MDPQVSALPFQFIAIDSLFPIEITSIPLIGNS